MLETIFDSILAENAEKLFDKPVDAGHPLRSNYFARLWASLFYFWEKRLRTEADVQARQVVDDIKSQYKENNVFDHVVLAVATVRNEQKAYLVFHDLYHKMFPMVAANNSAGNLRKVNQDDCRETVFDRLVGPPEKETANRIKNARLERYRGHGSFRLWLYTAVNRLISSYLSNNSDDFNRSYSIHKNVMNPPEEIGSALQQSEELNRLDEIVKTLSEEERQLIHLYYYEGLTYEEIGRLLGCNKTTVMRRLEAIRDRIKKQWGR